MAAKKLFINPLTRSSENGLNLSPTTSESDVPVIKDNRGDGSEKRTKSRERVFEETHERFTAWMDKELKRQFIDLVARKKSSKTALLDEAIALLLHKQERKPYTRQTKTE